MYCIVFVLYLLYLHYVVLLASPYCNLNWIMVRKRTSAHIYRRQTVFYILTSISAICLVQATTFLVRCSWRVQKRFEAFLLKHSPEWVQFVLSFTKVEIATEDKCLL